MKRKTVLGIVGFGLIGLAVLGLLLRAVFHVKTGTDWGYRNYKYQPMTYLGLLATLGIAALVGVVGLYHRLKHFLEKRRP